jgi:hypothetical protein
MRLREQPRRIVKRQQRRDDDVTCLYDTVLRDHLDARLALRDIRRSSLLEHVAAATVDERRESEAVLARVEERLVVEANRACNRERQRRLVNERGGKPQAQRGADLNFDLLQVIG